ncbi:MAG: hypothetical protein AB8G15_15685, partial [Saprospiraceae bacterium]
KLAEAEAFYKSLENSLTKKHLILDLRDNPGGGKRNSDILLKILKKYLKKNSVYVLTNHNMASNGEHFTMKITKLSDRCVTFGDRTNGTAAYEVKNSIFTLPCKKYVAVLTSKKHKKYLPIESQGITPLVYLDYERSWIEQVQEYIAKGF